MGRIPFQRVPHRPPYVARPIDRFLIHAADEPSTLILEGGGPRRGVTRTLKVFVQGAAQMRFNGPPGRYPIVVDFLEDPWAEAPETLVRIRNQLVKMLNRAFGLTRAGTHLFEFDALYTIWKEQAGPTDEKRLELEPTARDKVARRLAKVAVTVGTAGVTEVVGTVVELAELAKAMGWGVSETLEAVRDDVAERAFEERIPSAQDFLRKAFGPIVSRRLRAGKKYDELKPDEFVFLMFEALQRALARIQEDQGEAGWLILVIDSIDELRNERLHTRHNESVRFVHAGLALDGPSHRIAGYMCGRRISDAWLSYFNGHDCEQMTLGLIPKADIRRTLELEGLDGALIDAVLYRSGREEEVVAGDFDFAFRRLVKVRPKK